MNAETERLKAAGGNLAPRVLVYDFPNGFHREAENMFGWLRHEGFSPEWNAGFRDGEHRTGITIPSDEVPQLRIFQKTNPARWGNPPDVKKALVDNQRKMETQAKINREKMDKLTEDQRDWIERIHYETHLTLADALALNEILHELAVLHFKLALLSTSENGLTKEQELARDGIEQRVREVLADVPNVKGADFSYDPRGLTVGVRFESGASNSLKEGVYKVPLDPRRVKAFDNESVLKAYISDKNGSFVSLTIDTTENAAFNYPGRDQEIARIVDDAAEKIASLPEMSRVDLPLYDVNGNRVGEVKVTDQPPSGEPANDQVRLSINIGRVRSIDHLNGEIARMLREAANTVRSGEHVFVMRDTNDNLIGKFEFRVKLSLDKGDVIDMEEALLSDRVYLADYNLAGAGESEYRFFVPAEGFEPGYGQGECRGWLVNAKGEKAPDYDNPKLVRETDFRALDKAEKSNLLAVIEGRLTFEDFERKFENDDPGPK